MRRIDVLISALLISISLFSGQTMADDAGHKYYIVPNADSVLRHNADSDALRARAREAVEESRERQRKYLALRWQ